MSDGLSSAVDRLVNATADIALKAFSGAVIFLLADGLLGILLGALFPQTHIFPFYFTCYFCAVFLYFSEKIGTLYSLILLYFLFWALGKLIFIMRQPLFLDRIKSDYTSLFSESNELLKNFRSIRRRVVLRLERELPKDLLESISLSANDYMLYQILGRFYGTSPVKKRSGEADDIAFVGTNLIFVLLLLFFLYFWKLWPSYPCWAVGFLLVGAFAVFSLYGVFLRLVAGRFISRNMRFYVNYLLDTESLKEKVSKKKSAEEKSDSSKK